MQLRPAPKGSEPILGVVRRSRQVLQVPRILRRNAGIRDYLASAGVRKLQIGASPACIEGWLGMEIGDGAVFPDATELLPFADRVFDYVHVDHVIERVSWEEGALLLRECHRILKPGGTLRIATPDIAALFGLYAGEAGADGEEYIRWSTARFVAPAGLHSATFAINHAFHQGRRFLYDAGLMERALGEAGFAEIQRCARGESAHPHLRGMETGVENGGDEEGLAGFGTMLFEATVPA